MEVRVPASCRRLYFCTASLLLALLTSAGVSTAVAAPFSKPVAHDAAFFPTTEDLVRPGDTMRATVIRNDKDLPMTTMDAKWVSRIDWLNAVTTPGVHKALTFSAVDDVRNLLPFVPADVDYIEYNMEGGMTPDSDYLDTAASVAAISEIVRASGRKLTFGPILYVWVTGLDNKAQFEAVVRNCDAVAVQMQKYFESNPTIEALQAQVRPLVARFKAVNPNVVVTIQLWIGRQTVGEMVQGFRAIEPEVDVAVIGTHGDEAGVRRVMEILRADVAREPVNLNPRLRRDRSSRPVTGGPVRH